MKLLKNLNKHFLIKPNDINSRINLGSLHQHNSDYAEAILQYEEILKIDSTNHEALNNLGIIYQNLGQPDEAIESYMQAQKANPKFSGSYYNLGMVYQELGFINKAIEQLKHRLKLTIMLGLIIVYPT